MRIFTIVLGLVLAASFVGGCGSSNDEPRSGKEGKRVKVKQTSGLYEAARRNNVEQIEELLGEGYDIDSKGKDGRTALWVACYEGYVRYGDDARRKGCRPDDCRRGLRPHTADVCCGQTIQRAVEVDVDEENRRERAGS